MTYHHSNGYIPCPACDDTGQVSFKRTIGQVRNMPWSAACLCSRGDKYADAMQRATQQQHDDAVLRRTGGRP